ncbi:hypothetical protein ACS0TY_035854 [Phlomoides rotata]
MANRKDNEGRRYDFVRFGKGINQAVVLEKLNTIWFGTYKLRANIARFERNWNNGREKYKEYMHTRNPMSGLIANQHKAKRSQNISYADITRNYGRKEPEKNTKSMDKLPEWAGIKYTSTEKD